ncbi:hypothetical protein PV08_04001 [Exophiala spinifera]|uniref:Uncharacterized protein n=1 Tax=Exophiala spinifera TaxID=91928 RepID=A0A0D1YNV7_9EURO|nr:uncharacterized protein PV08_04001 [Exophiala spinifera]KIW16811.1 hypothetical protein PV08_04001 [Exophiala spinifera]
MESPEQTSTSAAQTRLAEKYQMSKIALLAMLWEQVREPSHIGALASHLERICLDTTWHPAARFPGIHKFCCNNYDPRFGVDDARRVLREIDSKLSGFSEVYNAADMHILHDILTFATVPFRPEHVLGLAIYGCAEIRHREPSRELVDFGTLANDLVVTVRSIVDTRGPDECRYIAGNQHTSLHILTQEVSRHMPYHADMRELCGFLEEIDDAGCQGMFQKAFSKFGQAVFAGVGFIALAGMMDQLCLGPQVEGRPRLEKIFKEEQRATYERDQEARRLYLQAHRDFVRRFLSK